VDNRPALEFELLVSTIELKKETQLTFVLFGFLVDTSALEYRIAGLTSLTWVSKYWKDKS